MDRDRRPRDIPPEDQFGNGRGQSYRPGKARDRTPPRMDSYRGRSPPPRRPDYLGGGDSYRGGRPRSRSPPLPPPGRGDDFRRRSPSPRFREHDLRGGDSYRGPPRRDDLPRDDLFRRENGRDQRDFQRGGFRDDARDRGHPPPGRSPLRYRDRSPLPLKRARDPSPISSRGRRTPPLQKRERLSSPQRGRFDDFPLSRGSSPPRRRFESPTGRERNASPPRSGMRDVPPRSRSPYTRNGRPDARRDQDWRRPGSPPRDLRQDHLSREESGHNSAATSRRSSPPPRMSHPGGAQPMAQDERIPSTRASPRDAGFPGEPSRALPAESRRPADLDSQPMQQAPGGASPRPEPRHVEDPAPATPRAPPTGPAGQRNAAAAAGPPTGPAAGSATRTPAAPPSGPRASASGRGDFAARGRGGFGADFTPRGRGGSFTASYRGGRGGTPTGPSFGRSESFQQETPPAAPRGGAPPSGPRAAAAIPSGPAASFRQNSATGPSSFARSQRFGSVSGDAGPDAAPSGPPTGPKATRRPTDSATSYLPRQHPALADLPQIVENGKKAEPLVDRSKVAALEEEAEKLRRQLDDKEARNRRSLREWDRLTRDTEAAALRSELAERALRQLNGEAEMQAAF